jgi:VCBS repeat-containing protein
MPISQAMCSSFKQQLFLGEHDLDTDTIKLALYTSAATLGAATTAYTTSDEVSSSGTNYTAGGNTLTGATVSLSGTTAFVDFSDTSWSSATITARGALVYNASKSNKAIAVLDFGSDKTSTNGTFTVQMPANTASDALIRIA